MRSLILCQYRDLKMGDMRRFRSLNHSTCKTALNLLEAIYLRLRKIVVKRVTVVRFGVGNRGSDGTGSFRIKVRTVGYSGVHTDVE